MPQVGELHINKALSNFATQLGVGSFAAPFIAPVLPVEKESDDFWIGGREELDDDRDTEIAPGDPAPEMKWTMTKSNYKCREHARSHPLPHRVRDNADTPIRPQQRAVSKLRGVLDLRYEKRVKVAATNTAVVPTDVIANLGAGAQWGASSGTKIELNVNTAKDKIRQKIGKVPNRIVIPPSVALQMMIAPELLDLRKAWDQTLLVDGMLPNTLWGMQLLIPGSLQNNANPGQAASVGDLWTEDNVLLFYYEEPSLEYSGFFITFRKRTAAGTDYEVLEWLNLPGRKADLYQVGFIQDEKIANPEAGFLITDVL